MATNKVLNVSAAVKSFLKPGVTAMVNNYEPAEYEPIVEAICRERPNNEKIGRDSHDLREIFLDHCRECDLKIDECRCCTYKHGLKEPPYYVITDENTFETLYAPLDVCPTDTTTLVRYIFADYTCGVVLDQPGYNDTVSSKDYIRLSSHVPLKLSTYLNWLNENPKAAYRLHHAREPQPSVPIKLERKLVTLKDRAFVAYTEREMKKDVIANLYGHELAELYKTDAQRQGKAYLNLREKYQKKKILSLLKIQNKQHVRTEMSVSDIVDTLKYRSTQTWHEGHPAYAYRREVDPHYERVRILSNKIHDAVERRDIMEEGPEKDRLRTNIKNIRARKRHAIRRVHDKRVEHYNGIKDKKGEPIPNIWDAFESEDHKIFSVLYDELTSPFVDTREVYERWILRLRYYKGNKVEFFSKFITTLNKIGFLPKPEFMCDETWSSLTRPQKLFNANDRTDAYTMLQWLNQDYDPENPNYAVVDYAIGCMPQLIDKVGFINFLCRSMKLPTIRVPLINDYCWIVKQLAIRHCPEDLINNTFGNAKTPLTGITVGPMDLPNVSDSLLVPCYDDCIVKSDDVEDDENKFSELLDHTNKLLGNKKIEELLDIATSDGVKHLVDDLSTTDLTKTSRLLNETIEKFSTPDQMAGYLTETMGKTVRDILASIFGVTEFESYKDIFKPDLLMTILTSYILFTRVEDKTCKFLILFMLAHKLGLFVVFKDAIMKTIDFFFTWWKGEDEPVVKSGGEETFIGAILSTLFFFINTILGGVSIGFKTILKMFKNIGSPGRDIWNAWQGIQGLSKIGEWISDCIKKAVCWATGTELENPDETLKRRAANQIAIASELTSPINKGAVLGSLKLCKEVLTCKQALGEIQSELLQIPGNNIGLANLLRQYTRDLDTLVSDISHNNVVRTSTRAPFHLVLWGDPGCGKSVIAEALCEALSKDVYSSNATAMVHKMTIGLDHDDGFKTGMKILYIDDSNQLSDAASYCHKMALVRSGVTYMKMADLSDKGSVATFDQVIETTNDYRAIPKDVICHDAALRTMNLYKISLPPVLMEGGSFNPRTFVDTVCTTIKGVEGFVEVMRCGDRYDISKYPVIEYDDNEPKFMTQKYLELVKIDIYNDLVSGMYTNIQKYKRQIKEGSTTEIEFVPEGALMNYPQFYAHYVKQISGHLERNADLTTMLNESIERNEEMGIIIKEISKSLDSASIFTAVKNLQETITARTKDSVQKWESDQLSRSITAMRESMVDWQKHDTITYNGASVTSQALSLTVERLKTFTDSTVDEFGVNTYALLIGPMEHAIALENTREKPDKDKIMALEVMRDHYNSIIHKDDPVVKAEYNYVIGVPGSWEYTELIDIVEAHGERAIVPNTNVIRTGIMNDFNAEIILPRKFLEHLSFKWDKKKGDPDDIYAKIYDGDMLKDKDWKELYAYECEHPYKAMVSGVPNSSDLFLQGWYRDGVMALAVAHCESQILRIYYEKDNLLKTKPKANSGVKKIMHSIYEKVGCGLSWVARFFRFVGKRVVNGLLITLGVGIGFGMLRLIGELLTPPASVKSGRMEPAHRQTVYKPMVKSEDVHIDELEVKAHVLNADAVVNRYAHNRVALTFSNFRYNINDKPIPSMIGLKENGNGFIVKGRQLLTARHMVPWFDTEPYSFDLTLHYSAHSMTCRIMSEDIFYFGDNIDACIIYIRYGESVLGDATKHFISDTDIPHLQDSSMRAYLIGRDKEGYRSESTKLITRVRRVYDQKTNMVPRFLPGVNVTVKLQKGERRTSLDRYVEVDEGVLGGDSGGIFTTTSTNIDRTFVGVISCGGSTYTMFTIVTREMLVNANLFFAEKFNTAPMSQECTIKCDLRPINDSTNFEGIPLREVVGKAHVLGLLPSQLTTPLQKKTNLSRSILYDEMEPNREPALLTMRDERAVQRREEGKQHFLKDSMERYFVNDMRPVDESILHATAEIVTQLLKSELEVPIEETFKPLSIAEAVIGLREPGYNPMNTNTSPGFPWTLTRTQRGKKDWIQISETGNLAYIDNQLIEAVNETERQIVEERVVPDCLQLTVMKDELRKSGERLGRTRTIDILPLHWSIVARRHLLKFFAYVHRAATRGSTIAVGLNICSSQALRLFYRMTMYGENTMLDMDFKGFDGHTGPMYFNLIKRVLFNFIKTHQSRMIIEAYFDAVQHSPFALANVVMKKPMGMSSGSVGTAELNSINHLCLNVLAWLLIRRDHGMSLNVDWQHYLAAKRDVVYGDDDWEAIHPGHADYINNSTLPSKLAELGWQVTTADKNVVFEAFKTTQEIVFLQHRFDYDPINRVVWTPIGETIIHNLLSYQRGDDPNQLYTNIGDAINFAFHHDRAIFDDIVRRINNGLEKHGKIPVFYDYDQLRREYVKNYYTH